MSNELITTAGSNNALAMLPKAPEVVRMSRNLKRAAVVGLIIAGGFLAPVVTLSLLSLAKMFSAGIAAFVALGVLLVVAYGVPHYVRIGKLWIDMKAEELTWEYIERDPLVPGILYLKDIEAEGEEYGDQLGNIEEVVEQTTAKRDEALAKAQKAEERARETDPETSEFRSLAHEVSVWGNVVERLNGRIADGQQMAKELGELYDVYKSTARDLKVDIDGQRTDWESSKIFEASMNSAEKLLIKGSERKAYAEKAAKFIADNYVGTFGRLRSIRKLSGEMVSAYRADQSAASKQLLSKWQKEKQALLPVIPAQTVTSMVGNTNAYANVFNNHQN